MTPHPRPQTSASVKRGVIDGRRKGHRDGLRVVAEMIVIGLALGFFFLVAEYLRDAIRLLGIE